MTPVRWLCCSVAAGAGLGIFGNLAGCNPADAAPSAPSGVMPIAPTYVDNVNGVVCYTAGAALSCVKVR